MIAKLVFNWTVLGMDMLNVGYWEFDTDDLAGLQDYVDYIGDLYSELFDGFSNDAQLTGVTAYNATTGDPFGFAYSFTGGVIDGNQTGNNLPPQTAGLIHWRADNTTYPHTGRMFVPGVTVDHLSADGTPNNGYLVILAALGAGLINLAPVAIPSAPKVTVKVDSEGAVIASAILTTTIVRDKFATMRSRGYES